MIESAQFEPDWISHPGETIEDLLEERGWTPAELARRTKYTPKHVNELIRGRGAITADTAGRLARVLGSTVQFWLIREARYRAALERSAAEKELETHAGWLKELPYSWMAKQGYVRSVRSKGRRVEECLRFFEVASVEAWRDKYERPIVAWRASPSFDKKIGAVATWLRAAEQEAQEVQCRPFNKSGFREWLSDEGRSLTRESDPKVFVPSLRAACARLGVAVVLVPYPPGCPVSGASWWLEPGRAILALSLRHKSNDHLWFSFFHEAAHLLLHGKKMRFIEGIDGLNEDLEEEANRFARDCLIPPKEARRLSSLETDVEMRRFAKEIGIAAGIVVGRAQKEGLVPWKSRLNSLKVRYTWASE